MSDVGARLDLARGLVESALLSLEALPGRVDRRPIVVMIDRSLALFGRVVREPIEDAAHLDGVAGASAAIMAAAALLMTAAPGDATASDAGARLRRARRELDAYRAEAIEEIASKPVHAQLATKAAANDGRAWVASDGTPALHHLERGALAPIVRVDPKLSAASFDPSAAMRELGARVPQYDTSATRFIAQLRRLARDSFEEIGSLGGLREPNDDVPWSRELASFEQRLLCDLDAAVALGDAVMFDGTRGLRLDVLRELLAWAADTFTIDPGRAFARPFVLACVEGEDKVRAAVLALRQSPVETHDAELRAFALGSSPAIAAAMEELAMGDDERLAVLGLEVLRARREGGAAIAVLLAHPRPPVRSAAARVLGASLDRVSAIAMLCATDEVEREPEVQAAIATSLARLAAKPALAIARAGLDGRAEGEAKAALRRVLALTGGPSDASMLLQELGPNATRADVEAIGWHGHPGAIEPLAQALEAATLEPLAFELRDACIGAIARITGETVDATPEGIDAFRTWWRAHEAHFGSETSRRSHRFRHGRAFTPMLCLDELAGEASPVDREWLALELAVYTRGTARIETRDWIARQLSELEAARAFLSKTPVTPGKWPVDQLD
jgi:hypothetical protein